MEQMLSKYPHKKLVFLLDNLSAHKSISIMKIMQEERASMMFTPSNTP